MPDGPDAAESGTTRSNDHRLTRRDLMRAGGGILLATAAGNALGNGSAFGNTAPTGTVTPQLIGTETVGQSIGGGNFSNDETHPDRFTLLDDLRASWIRTDWYPAWYYNNGAPSPSRVDPSVLLALQRNKKIHGHFAMAPSFATPRSYSVWFSIGAAFATRFQPGSAFLRSQGIADRGIESWAAINEPDLAEGGVFFPFADYRNMIKGLADGIHSVDANARVYPGGYAAPCRELNGHDTHGMLPAIADLVNNGTLAGIDLHTYHDVAFAPIHNTYSNSTQHDFDLVKSTCGITRDIELLITEHNYKDGSVGQGYNDSWAARYFVPHFFDQLGVVGNSGTPKTRIAMYWNLFRQGPGWAFGTNTVSPISYRVTGSIYKRFMTVLHPMRLTRADPKGRGDFVFEGGGTKAWVFQNIHSSWSSIYGSSYTVTGIPAGSPALIVWNYTGQVASVPTNGSSTVTVSTPTGYTYMIIAARPT